MAIEENQHIADRKGCPIDACCHEPCPRSRALQSYFRKQGKVVLQMFAQMRKIGDVRAVVDENDFSKKRWGCLVQDGMHGAQQDCPLFIDEDDNY